MQLAPAASATTRRAPAPAPVRVVTLNVKAFQLSDGGDADVRAFDAIERYLERIDADVVLLQELDRGTRRSGGVDQLAELARRTDATDAEFAPAIRHDGGDYGVGILTRNGHAIADAGATNDVAVVRLPKHAAPGADREQRVALVAPIVAPGGARFTAVSTHLSRSGPGRGAQVDRIDDIVDDVRGGAANVGAGLSDGLPTTVVVGGDFNTRRRAAERHLGEGVRHVGDLAPRLGDTGIDHIYVGAGVRVLDAAVDRPERIERHHLPWKHVYATDHPAVRATLQLG